MREENMVITDGTHLLGPISARGKMVVVKREQGVFSGLTQEQYRLGEGLANSSLGYLMKSGRTLWYEEQERLNMLHSAHTHDLDEVPDGLDAVETEEKRNAALVFGAAMHKLVLEPETWETEFVVVPPEAPRRPSDKQRMASRPSAATVAAIEWWDDFERGRDGRQAILAPEYARMWEMYDALRSHWFDVDGLHIPTLHLFKGGHAEASIYWVDEETGVFCKGRPDYISDGFIADYKTATDGSLYGFQKSMADFGYYRQSPYYLDGMRVASKGASDHNRFLFVVQEKKRPYEVFVYAIGLQSQDIGRSDYRRLLHRYVENTKKYGEPGKGEMWPMACHSILDVELPQWAMFQGGLVK